MKDAKGHGSDPRGAHAEGVQQVGQQQQTLHWEKMPHGMGHALLPESGSYPAIASVSRYRGSSGGPSKGNQFQAQLHQSFNTGAARSGNWSVHGSVQGAKNWVERTISNSWTAPIIRK